MRVTPTAHMSDGAWALAVPYLSASGDAYSGVYLWCMCVCLCVCVHVCVCVCACMCVCMCVCMLERCAKLGGNWKTDRHACSAQQPQPIPSVTAWCTALPAMQLPACKALDGQEGLFQGLPSTRQQLQQGRHSPKPRHKVVEVLLALLPQRSLEK